MDLFTRYAKTKIAIRKLDLELKDMQIEIAELIDEGFSHKTPYGTISKYTPKRWVYGDNTKKEIKRLQEDAKEKGEAELVEGSPVIKYTAPRNL